jgi:hypothetical protein
MNFQDVARALGRFEVPISDCSFDGLLSALAAREVVAFRGDRNSGRRLRCRAYRLHRR